MGDSKKRYTTEELARIYDAGDWGRLWKIMEPMVKHAVRRLMQSGLDPYYVREDLMQEAYLAAWASLPRWNAFEGSLQTWVRANVGIAVMDRLRRDVNGMIGGRDSGYLTVSMHSDPERESENTDDEAFAGSAPESRLVYEDPPEGLGDPSDGDPERLLELVPEKHRDMVRRLCGMGVPAETQEEYARSIGVPRGTIAWRLSQLRSALQQNPEKPLYM